MLRLKKGLDIVTTDKKVDSPRTCSSTSNVVKRVCKCEGERTGNVEEEWKEIWKTPDWCNNKCDIGLGESLETGGNNCKRNYTKEQCDSSYFQETSRSGKLCYWNGNSWVPLEEHIKTRLVVLW